jgi:plastocyanin
MRRIAALVTSLCFLAACGEDSPPSPTDTGTKDVFFANDVTVSVDTQEPVPDAGDAGPQDTALADASTDASVAPDDSPLPPEDTSLNDGVADSGPEDTAAEDSLVEDAVSEDVPSNDTGPPLTLCEQYCILADLNCTEGNAINFGPQPCLAQCETWPVGTPGDMDGDSVQCRIYHLGAATNDPEVHCPHAAPDGGGVCIVPDFGNNAGDTCQTAGVALLSPQINSASTLGQKNNYTSGSCGFTAGTSKDVAWILNPPMSGVYTFTLTPEQGGPTVLYVVEDCDDISNTCMGFMNGLTDGPLEATLIGGQSYRIVIDGWNAGQAGAFDLEISPPCIPSCAAFQECGDDGCGGSCGTCNPNDPNGWTTCDPATTTCVKPKEAQANTCEKAIPVNTLPFVFSGSTSNASNNYGYGPSACPGVEYHWGNGSKDHTFVLQPGLSAIYTIELEADFDSTLYVVGDCENIDASCVAASEKFGKESLVLELVGGVPYYVIVDGYANDFNESGDYTLTVGEPCIPMCQEGYCGSDGCGGECFCGVSETCFEQACCTPVCDGLSCGPLADGCGGECGCSDGLICGDEGVCSVAPMGEQCFNPIVIAENPFSQAGTTALGYDDHMLTAGACGEDSPELGKDAADAVYTFVPEVSATYSVNLTANYEASLYILTDCGGAAESCLGYEDTPGPKTVALAMEAGTTYFLIVDGLGPDGINSGGYVLQIAAPCAPQCEGKQCGEDSCGSVCGECGPGGTCDANQLCDYPDNVGDDCDSPFIVESLPYTHTSDTTGATNQTQSSAPTCFEVGAGSNDHVYQVATVENGTLSISVTGKDGFDPVLYTRQECSDTAAGVCIDGTIDNGTETLEVDVLADQIWHVFVDGWNNNLNEAGLYELNLTFTAEVPEAGETCADATVISQFPATVTGDTSDAADDYASSICNPAAFEGGPDHVWVLEPSETGTYSFALTGAATIAYVVSDCADLGACEGFKSFFGDPTPSSVQLEGGKTYYLVVDGYAQWEFGEYTLDVTFDGAGPVTPDTLLLINEVDYDQPGADSSEFVELMNPTEASIATAGLYLVYINGTTGLPYATVPLNELGAIEAGGYAVVGSPGALQQVPLGIPTMPGPFSIQNGSPDAIALVAGDPAQPGAAAWDIFTYEGVIEELGDGTTWWTSEGDAGTDNEVGSLGRCPNGVDTDDNGADYVYADVSPGQANPCLKPGVSVSITDGGFVPGALTVAAGTTVTWTNNGSMIHTVTSVVGISDDALTYDPLDSQELTPGASFEYTFENTGVFHYRCAPHAFMKGSVIVE